MSPCGASGHPGYGRPMSATDPITHAIDTLEGVLPGVTDWSAPSPCAGWTLRDVLAHVTGTLGKAHQIVTGSDAFRRLPFDPRELELDAAGVRLLWDEHAAAVRAVMVDADLDRPVDTRRGPEPLRRALALPSADVACHAWDLAVGSGQLLDLPEPLLEVLRADVGALPEDALRSPGLFGPAVEPTPGASETDRLMAWLGRSRP